MKIEGGKANNIVLAKMTCTLEKLPGLVEFLKNNPKDYIQYKEQDETVELEVSGIPAHGSIPFKGDSAFARFSSFFAKFGGLSEPDAHIIRECAAMLSDCYGIDFGIEDNDPEMGKLTVGNARVYKEDGKLGLTLDIRFGCRVPNDVVKQKLNDNLEARGFALTTSRGSIAFRIDPECKLAKTLLDTYRKASGNPDAKYFYMTGGTYSKIMQPESVSFSTGAHCDGYIERLGLPAGHGNVHEADETVGKEEFLKGIEYLGLIYLDIDKAY